MVWAYGLVGAVDSTAHGHGCLFVDVGLAVSTLTMNAANAIGTPFLDG